MTPAEKLALIRRSYGVFNAGLDIETLMPLYHPDFEWLMVQAADAGADAGPGHEGLSALVAVIGDNFESFTTVLDEARITRAGALLLRNHGSFRSRDTGTEVLATGWQEAEFRDGLISRVVMLDEPPAGWNEATPLDLGLTPDTGT